MKTKTAEQYQRQLKKLIEHRTGVPCEVWMELPIRTASMCLVTLDKMQAELSKQPLVFMETGSQTQSKTVINPLVAAYKDMHRTMLMHYENLGLSYKNDPSRIASSAKKEDEGNGVQGWLDSI